jgi:hydroxymethylpyrimidine pyrophosphatase-like HAD family hydrolase
MDHNNVGTRLLKEWIEHKELIIAVDFDNTIFDYHEQGHDYSDIINVLKRAKKIGAYIIIYTAADSGRYPSIKKYLNENNIPFDNINENKAGLPFASSNSKVYYNVLLDDRAGLESAFKSLVYALRSMENKEEE